VVTGETAPIIAATGVLSNDVEVCYRGWSGGAGLTAGACRTLTTLFPLRALRSLRTRGPLFALPTLYSRWTLLPFCALRPLGAGRPLLTLGSLRSGRTLFPFCTLRAL
jgi:hypothetical protein